MLLPDRSAPPDGPPGPVVVGASYALVLALTLLVAVWGAFLVPLRTAGGGVPLPVSLLLAAAMAPLTAAGARLLGRLGGVVPVGLWLVVALALGARRPEGDVVVTGSLVGTAYLLGGAVACAVGFGWASAQPRNPRRPPGRPAGSG